MAREIQSIPVNFANTGIVIKSAADEIPQAAYRMLSNAQTDKENTVSVRSGFTRLNDGLPTAPYSAYFLKDYNNRQWRYAITGGKLYVAPVEDPADASVWPIALGNDFGEVYGGGSLSSASDPRALFTTFSLQGTEMKPYIFLADGTVFLKHSGGLDSARRVGIPAPANPINSMDTAATADELLEEFEDYTEWTGGDSSTTSAPDSPSRWWYNTGTQGGRWYYAKYSFVLNDASETFVSESGNPTYVPSLKCLRAFWKPPISSLGYTDWVGNESGYYYNDISSSIPEGARVHSITINHGTYIDRIKFRWMLPDGTFEDSSHAGGGGGTEETFTLDFDEYITEITGKSGTKIDSIQFTTNKRTSKKYGGDGGNAWSITLPVPIATAAYSLVGFRAYAGGGDSAYQAVLLGLNFIYRVDGFDSGATAPAAAVGWNLYLGESSGNLRKVNDSTLDLAEYYDEPAGGPTYQAFPPPLPNVGDLSDDPSGVTDNGMKISVTGSSKSGRAIKTLVNSVGYPTVKDLGTLDPEESFKISIKFENQEAIDNCEYLALSFILSDLPGDIGDKYHYYAVATITEFSAFTPGSWTEIQLYKSDFVLSNYGGSGWSGLGWDTVTAIQLEIVTIDPATGGETCNVSFDDLYYSPIGKLNGSDLQWTYTFYDSKTDTESDYAEPFSNTLGALSDQQVLLQFPETPYTNPPLANPDKIRIYRMGNTIEQFQLVDEIDYVAGFAFEYRDNKDDNSLGDLLETDNQLPPDGVDGCEIYANRLWTWGGSVDGVPEPKNKLRFSKGTRIEHFPSDFYIYVGSGNEQIMRALEHDGELFVFTLTRVYRVIGDSPDTYAAVSTAVNQGLTNKHCACRGSHGLYMRAYDGIYEFPSGRKISEPINQVFFGQTVNGIEPVASGREDEEAMGFWNSRLYFSYCATEDAGIENDRTLIYDINYERWFWYIYGAQGLFAEPETNILIGCNITQWYTAVAGVPIDQKNSGEWPMHLETGFSDIFDDDVEYGIPCIIDTREYDLGFPDQEKQFIDLIVDAETQGYPVTIQASFDGEDYESIGVVSTSSRQRIPLPVVLGDENSFMAVRMSLRITFESDPNATDNTRIYKVVHRVLLEPPRHRTHVTDWSLWGSEGPKYFHKLWVEMDTFGEALDSIEVYVDGELVKTIEDNITADGRRKFYYGLGIDVRGTLARVKFKTSGEINEVKIYDFGFEVTPEPPLINSYQQVWTDNGWPYRKLWKHIEFEIDTEDKLIDFDFWVDGEIAQSFSLTANGRQHIVQSLDQNIFGKLGRVTVNMDQRDAEDELQGVRFYAEPKLVTDQRSPDVTVADSFEQTLVNPRIKVLRKIWYVIDNPNEDVNLDIYIDNYLKGSFTISATSTLSPDIETRRLDIPSGYKGRLMRFVFTSGQAFEIDWPKSHIILRDVNNEDPHRRPRLEPPQTY
jgi:hypothetical protein